MYIALGISRTESILNLVGVFCIFLLILLAAYFTSRWVGKVGVLQINNPNIKLIETFRISQSKCIQIVKIGTKYIAIGVSKDHIEVLTELTEDELVLQSKEDHKQDGDGDFKQVLAKMLKKK